MLNDGIQDGRDVSWIYDADIERLAGLVSTLVVSGRRADDLALRFALAGIEPAAVDTDTRSALRSALLATPAGGRLEIVATYTAMLEVRELLAQHVGRRALLGGPSVNEERRAIRVVTLYPDVMSIYADRGNLIALRARCRGYGIDCEVTPVTIGVALPAAADLVLIGGGQDQEQRRIAADLASKGVRLRDWAEADVAMLTVCGGFQLFGHSYRTAEGEELPGVGIFDVTTVAPRPARPAASATCSRTREVSVRSSASRTTAGVRTSAPPRARSPACASATATTATTVPRAPSTARRSGPTCTARCCRRTPPSPTA